MYKRNLNYLYRFLRENKKKCAKVRGCYQRDAFIYNVVEYFRGFMYFNWLLISFCTYINKYPINNNNIRDLSHAMF